MKATTFARKIRKAYNEDGASMDDNGERVRVTKECRQHGDDVIEVGCSYFYQFQADVERVLDDIRFYAEHLGYEVEFEAVGRVRYRSRTWPKTSWATQLFRVEVRRQ